MQIKPISHTIFFVTGRLGFVKTRGGLFSTVNNPSAFYSSGLRGWAWPWVGRTFCCRPASPRTRLFY